MSGWWMAYLAGAVIVLALLIYYVLTSEEVHKKHGERVSEYPTETVINGTGLILVIAGFWPCVLVVAALVGLAYLGGKGIKRFFAMIGR